MHRSDEAGATHDCVHCALCSVTILAGLRDSELVRKCYAAEAKKRVGTEAERQREFALRNG